VRREFGESVLCIASDASDTHSQKQLAEALRESFGRLDILFVNAGIADLRPVEQWTESAWDHCFQTNVRGAFFLIQALLPLFANPSSVVLNASINAHIGMRFRRLLHVSDKTWCTVQPRRVSGCVRQTDGNDFRNSRLRAHAYAIRAVYIRFGWESPLTSGIYVRLRRPIYRKRHYS
jgi:NAD(P)-dependent dehydrogenase (short-subunit alcohol dehydrogenase family)